MYHSQFTVTSAASDRKLVSGADVELALGADFPAADAGVLAAILQVSDMIAAECRVPAAGISPPTFRQETLVETFRLERETSRMYFLANEYESELFLARRPATSITSVVVDGTTLAGTDYELNPGVGSLVRLSDDRETYWSGLKIVVTYVCGWATVPELLKMAAIRAIQEQMSAFDRDPLLRGETVEGVGRFDYWINSASSEGMRPISPAVAAMLDPFRYHK